MNEHTEKNINEAIDWLQSTGATIQDFAAEQAPLYCREVVAWEFWSNAPIGLLSIPLMVLAFSFFRKAQAKRDVDFLGFSALAALFAAMFFVVFGLPAIKAIAAPRLVIVEHLRSLKP